MQVQSPTAQKLLAALTRHSALDRNIAGAMLLAPQGAVGSAARALVSAGLAEPAGTTCGSPAWKITEAGRLAARVS